MDSILEYIALHAHQAHWIIFGLIMLAGLNVPLSEDLLMITGGAIVSSYLPDYAYLIFFWLFLACWWSAWEAYWIGRLLGPKLYQIRWFNWVLTPKKIDRLHHYYEKFGVFTFLVGRFIPGGVRNALFMSAGLGKMPFLKFILRDLPACFLSASFLFYLGYLFGENHTRMIEYFRSYNQVAIGLLASVGALLLIVRSLKKSAPETDCQ